LPFFSASPKAVLEPLSSSTLVYSSRSECPSFSLSILTWALVSCALFSRIPTSLHVSEIDNPESLTRYYELLLSVIRIINAVVVSRGLQNDQTIGEARRFLSENRASIVAVFKRHAKIGGVRDETNDDIEDLMECYVLLISKTNFLEVSNISSCCCPWKSC
jgi:hypothetical protein